MAFSFSKFNVLCPIRLTSSSVPPLDLPPVLVLALLYPNYTSEHGLFTNGVLIQSRFSFFPLISEKRPNSRIYCPWLYVSCASCNGMENCWNLSRIFHRTLSYEILQVCKLFIGSCWNSWEETGNWDNWNTLWYLYKNMNIFFCRQMSLNHGFWKKLFWCLICNDNIMGSQPSWITHLAKNNDIFNVLTVVSFCCSSPLLKSCIQFWTDTVYR